jgi:hypothetical protein
MSGSELTCWKHSLRQLLAWCTLLLSMNIHCEQFLKIQHIQKHPNFQLQLALQSKGQLLLRYRNIQGWWLDPLNDWHAQQDDWWPDFLALVFLDAKTFTHWYTSYFFYSLALRVQKRPLFKQTDYQTFGLGYSWFNDTNLRALSSLLLL